MGVEHAAGFGTRHLPMLLLCSALLCYVMQCYAMLLAAPMQPSLLRLAHQQTFQANR